MVYFQYFKFKNWAQLQQELTQIDDTRNWSVVQWLKIICKISAQYSLNIFYFHKSEKGIGHKLWQHYMLPSPYYISKFYSYYYTFIIRRLFSSICQSMMDKIAENCVFQVFKVQKGGKSLQELKQIDDTRIWYVVQYYKVIWKISVQYVKACRSKIEKVPRGIRVKSRVKTWQVRGLWIQQMKHK